MGEKAGGLVGALVGALGCGGSKGISGNFGCLCQKPFTARGNTLRHSSNTITLHIVIFIEFSSVKNNSNSP